MLDNFQMSELNDHTGKKEKKKIKTFYFIIQWQGNCDGLVLPRWQ